MVKQLGWGFCSASKIAHDFAHAMDLVSEQGHVKVAVAARGADRAEAFAKDAGVKRFYGTYEDLAKDSEVDIVYVSSLNITHFEHCKLFLNAGKHVLCEKPLTTSPADTRELVKLAQEKQLFFMEGFWSRCFPVYQEVKKLVDSGAIGEVKQVFCHFHICGAGDRVLNEKLGGSALMDIGCYTLNFADFINECVPERIAASGTLFEGTGVDHDVSIALKYPSGTLATLTCSINGLRPSTGMICGTKGFITVNDSMHAPTSYDLQSFTGDFALADVTGQPVQTKKIPFPTDKFTPNYVYAQGTGFNYEISHVKECLDKGLLQSPIVPHEASIRLADMTAEISRQIRA